MRHLPLALTRLAAGAVLALSAACSSPTGPDGAERFDFFWRTVFGFPRLEPNMSIVDGNVLVTGLLVTPTTGYSILGTLARPANRSLVMTVTATLTANGLNFPTQTYYTGTVSKLASGEYDVTLIHIIDREGRDSTVQLRQTLTVP